MISLLNVIKEALQALADHLQHLHTTISLLFVECLLNLYFPNWITGLPRNDVVKYGSGTKTNSTLTFIHYQSLNDFIKGL